MKIAFDKQCDCPGLEALYPKPSLSTRAPRVDDAFAYVEISFACPLCGTPWGEIIANNFGESFGPQIGRNLSILDPKIGDPHG